jgi:hypothetical protein
MADGYHVLQVTSDLIGWLIKICVTWHASYDHFPNMVAVFLSA